MATFKIGINMAGAISAGAYTAGVLDFLTEALDAWYEAKKNGAAVPMHDVSIEVFSGASAGGMCAAISAVMLQEDFEHIHDTTKQGTNNRFFESWVNKIDIRELLKAQDLKKGEPVVSLLDSTIIGSIAEYALKPDNLLAVPRKYVSPNLTLFLSLTNLRGIPYSLNGAAPGSIEESTFFYGDHIRFETSRTGAAGLANGTVRMLNLTEAGTKGGWDVLQTAAMATGAFPVFLAPRPLDRFGSEYVPPRWQSVTADVIGPPAAIKPHFPTDFSHPFPTLNVDGGVTNNDPFNYAHDFLAALEPASETGHNPQEPLKADRAVITVAPFPTTQAFEPAFDVRANASIFLALPRLFSALISQSRFFGESLDEIMTGTTFSRFIVAPSDDALGIDKTTGKRRPALQCAALGAFGGFFERRFRAHDYALGRRNCQKFLKDSFVLPAENVVMAAGLEAIGVAGSERRVAVEAMFRRPAPGSYAMSAEEMKLKGEVLPVGQAKAGNAWLPIIPLCSKSVADEIPRVERAKISHESLDLIVNLILKRVGNVTSILLDGIKNWGLRIFLKVGQPIIRWLGKKPLKKALIEKLGEDYER